jgi:hypothetical protein
MQASQTPTLVPLAFAANGTKNTIPEASQIGVTPGAASLNDGFPPLTFTPIAAGGVPPAGADFNGVLNLITQTIRWKHAGGQFGYNAAFAADTNVGGYPKGAILGKAGNNGLWMSTADNNATNPDTGGAGWIDPLAGRLLGVQVFTASGTYTPGTYNGVTATKAIVKAVGAGGGGAGCPSTTSTTIALGSGGNAGAEGELLIASGLSPQTVTIGAAGSAGSAGSNPGGAGGSTSFGSLMICAGGLGGLGGASSTVPPVATSLANPAAQVTGSGTLLVAKAGKIATVGIGPTTITIISSAGADSSYGQGGFNQLTASTGFGAGGSGASAGVNTASGVGGQPGRPGYLLVYEYA